MSGVLRKALVYLRGNKQFEYPELKFDVVEPETVQQMIFNRLTDDKPCMIARLGSVELQAVVDYLYPPTYKNAIRYIKGEIPAFGFAPSTQRTMNINAGFFPPTKEMLKRFGNIMLSCMSQVDILGSWRIEEHLVKQYLGSAVRVPLYTLEPYYFENPWMSALEGKRVLIVHPFEDTIRKQHQSGVYEKLFDDGRMTPSYELHTIKAVQSIAGNKPAQFHDWYQALDWMKEQINQDDFDVAIIGCGAYGFPLAAHVKSIGKKAVHLGGAVQYLFGIRSSAAEKNERLMPLINDCWVPPSETERPANHQVVENSRYW